MPSGNYELKHQHDKELFSTHKYRIRWQGTAIPIKDCYTLMDIQYMPTGSGITALFNGVKILNAYAPYGSEKA
jgi:hypothetical protein